MKNLLAKELRLAASPLSYLFILFAVMAFIPGYPILMAGFFICFGVFQTFQGTRETNDILYTALLPVKKSDAVKAKYLFTIFIQMTAFALTAVFTFIRMALIGDVEPYASNAMMNANQAFLGYILLIFALFNLLFVNGFFKTAYKIGAPFIAFAVASFLLITAAEAAHFVPGLEFLNANAALTDIRLWLILVVSAAIYAGTTYLAFRSSVRRFEKIDL